MPGTITAVALGGLYSLQATFPMAYTLNTCASPETTALPATTFTSDPKNFNPLQLEIMKMMLASTTANQSYQSYSFSFLATMVAVGIAVGGVASTVYYRKGSKDQYGMIPASDATTYQSTI